MKCCCLISEFGICVNDCIVLYAGLIPSFLMYWGIHCFFLYLFILSYSLFFIWYSSALHCLSVNGDKYLASNIFCMCCKSGVYIKFMMQFSDSSSIHPSWTISKVFLFILFTIMFIFFKQIAHVRKTKNINHYIL